MVILLVVYGLKSKIVIWFESELASVTSKPADDALPSQRIQVSDRRMYASSNAAAATDCLFPHI